MEDEDKLHAKHLREEKTAEMNLLNRELQVSHWHGLSVLSLNIVYTYVYLHSNCTVTVTKLAIVHRCMQFVILVFYQKCLILQVPS